MLSAPVTPHAVGAGVFVAFEGGDGAGKSTQARLLGDWVGEQGREVVLTREPGGTELGRTVRDVVLHGDHVTPRAEALLFAADRAHHVASLVRPALDRGAVVLTDRYVDSSIAYQGAARELACAEIRDLSLWATQGLLPHLTVLLDVAPKQGRARRGDVHDRLEREGEDFHDRVRRGFLDLAAADPSRYLVLDGDKPPEELHEAVVDRFRRLDQARAS
ncbi:MAG: dTMP kinase [Ornithinimicrobium sp.]|jgi:dTMP kinase|uniref:dTMP kinase n=1 Tax=Ornithinimicrobium sp. TaxID=1977084 RepID=UPI003D9B6C04